MARLSLKTTNRRQKRNQVIVAYWNQIMTIVVWFFTTICMLMVNSKKDISTSGSISSYFNRYLILYRHAYESDTICLSELRMTRMCFAKLCDMLKTLGGLKGSRNMSVEEQVAIFLHIIAHNVKNRTIICNFHRSGETISRLFSRVCNAVIRLHPHLLKKPEPIPESSTDQRWKWFKNCLGALDGTYITCKVPLKDKPRYRTRKNDIATNVLGVCSPDMQFIYVLPGWEGSAADSRVLRDALLRPHGLKIPRPGMTDKGRNYRNWTNIEDAKLVEALVNMVNAGSHKADNGFRSGYLQHLEHALKEALPDAGITGKPHIESRIKTMKKDWQIVYDMVNGTNTSGFGYDSVKQCVLAEPAVWESYIAVHKGAGKWRNKTFPHFEDLCTVFGKDRAQGNKAKDFVEMVDDANIEEQTLQMDDDLEDPMEVSHTNAESEECSSARTRKRKNRLDFIIEGITNAATVLGKELREASTSMTEILKAEVDLQNKTSMVSAEISKFSSMSRMDKFKASRKIMREPEAVLTFWNLEGDERETFVELILEE